MSTLLANYYEHLFSFPDSRLLDRATQGASNHRILDLGCGTGRTMKELCRKGFHVTGIDCRDDMLAACRVNLKGWEDRFSLVKADFSSYPLARREFGAIICFGNTLSMVLCPAARRRLLRSVADALADHGTAVFYVKNDAPSRESYRSVRKQVDAAELRMDVFSYENHVQSTRSYHLEISHGTESERHIFVTSLLSAESLRDEAVGEGLRLTALYGDLDLGLPAENSDWQVHIYSRADA